MYPTIHDYTARNLTTQGYGALSDCISCEVTEELNGGFTLEMTYPLKGLHSEYLVPGNIIMVKPSHNQSRQPFRINQVKKSFANNCQVYANHICYDLSGYPIMSAGSYSSLADVITAINSMTWSYGTATYHSFRFVTDMASTTPFKMEALQTVRSWMGGQEGSIIDTYGGEWVYDNFSCYLLSRRGIDTGYRISYGNNLAEYEKQRDNTAYSHVCAYWKKSEVIVYSALQATNIDCTFRVAYVDASSAYENQPTTADLNTYAASHASSVGLAQTITITPAQIGNNVIGLGDSVLICYENVLQTRVIKTVWDALGGVYKTLQLGTKKANIADTIKSLTTGPNGESGTASAGSTFYQATGSSGTLALANGTITQIPLVSTGAIYGGDSIFSISDGGIKVAESGNYKISGSVMLGTVNAVNNCGCYIKKGTSFSASTEIFNANIGKDTAIAPQFGVTSGTKIVALSANDIVYLCARVQNGTGTAYKDNKSTFLLIEKA